MCLEGHTHGPQAGNGPRLGSISPTFYDQLLLVQIPKAQKD